VWVCAVIVGAMLLQCYRDEGVDGIARRNERAAICAKISVNEKDFSQCIKAR
jgi:hypothetical protein